MDSPNSQPPTSRTIVREKNTNERAIVRVRIPKKKIEEEFVEVSESGEEVRRKVQR